MAELFVNGTFSADAQANIVVSGTSSVSLARSGASNYVLVWNGNSQVFERLYTANNTFVSGTVGTGSQATAISDAAGNYAVLYTLADGSLNGIGGRSYGAAGNSTNGPYLVNQQTQGDQQQAAAAALTTGYRLVAWTDYGNGAVGNIVYNAIAANGGWAFNAPVVVTAGASSSTDADATALANGGFVISYTGPNGAAATEANLSIFAANGVQVGSFSSGSLYSGPDPHTGADSSVATLAGGQLVMSWTDKTGTGANLVKVQLLSDTGAAIGSAITLGGSGVAADQAQVASLSNGGFVVTWRADDGSGGLGDTTRGEIMAQLFDANGQATGAAFMVNTTTVGGQDLPTVTTFGGNIVFAWHGWNADASEYVATRALYAVTNGTEDGESIYGTEGIDVLNGLGGNDLLFGLGGNDTLYGGDGNDYVDGGLGNDVMYGGDGNDVLIGNSTYNVVVADSDQMYGGGGDDVYFVGQNGDTAFENPGEGNDTVVTSTDQWTLGANFENLQTDPNRVVNYTLNGNTLANTIIGGALNDTIDGKGGADILRGGLGNDTYVYTGTETIIENPGEGTDTVRTAVASYTLGANLENVIGTAINGATQTLIGNALNNNITASGFADTLDGGAGADTMTGGLGNDTYYVDNAGDVVIEASTTGGGTADTVYASIATYTLTINVERLIGTSNLGQTLIGNASANTITGGDGDDMIDGGTGIDTLQGGLGNDTYYVDNTGDSVVETGIGIDIVRSSVSYTLGANVENLTLVGTSHINANGNALDNVLVGNSGNNLLQAGAGNDTLDGGTGADAMGGGDGDDVYYVDNAGDSVVESANQGNDMVYVSAANYTLTSQGVELMIGTSNLGQTLTGAADVNRIIGGAGNDIIDGGAGIDILEGGLGNDTYYVDNASDFVVETGSGIDRVISSVSYILTANTENVTLTGSANLTATGNALDNVLAGNSGNNILQGGAGNDTLDGGAGTDTMGGGTGDDIYVVDNAGDQTLEIANEGTDTVRTTLTNYTLAAEIENLTGTGNFKQELNGNALANVITGGSGDDYLDGRAGADTMRGGLGDDVIVVDDVGDVVIENAGEGNDSVYTTLAAYALGANIETLAGLSNSQQVLTGNTLVNVIVGGGGDDLIDGGIGGDSMIGAGGNDTYYVDSAGDYVLEQVGGGNDIVYTALAAYTLTANVETLAGTGLGQTLTGNDLINVIVGSAGNDTIDGGIGADSLIGAGGDDTYIVDDAGEYILEQVGAGTDTVLSSVSHALFANVENLTLTGTGASYGNGNALGNILIGNSGDNNLDGGAGADTMIGGLGGDTYIVDNAGDVVTENSGEGSDAVYTALAAYTLAANVETLVGTGLGQNLTGNALVNVIVAGAGNDVIDGGIGPDSLIGAGGDDTYIVDNAGEFILEQADSGIDTVLSSVSHALFANVENLTLTGTSAINGTGNALANVLTGNSGNNVLVGGGGNDSFVFGAGSGQDVIGDFQLGTDRIDISAYHYSWQDVQGRLQQGGNNATLDLGGGNTVVLNGVVASQLQQGDFILSGGGQSGTADALPEGADTALANNRGPDTILGVSGAADDFFADAATGVSAVPTLHPVFDFAGSERIDFSGMAVVPISPFALDAGDFIV